MTKAVAVVMAAGLGTRMKSQRSKIVHEICGKPIIKYVIGALKPLRLDKIILVVSSHQGEEQKFVTGNIVCVIQKEKKGTAHAVMQTRKILKNYNGDVIVLSGDVPLIRTETLKNLLLSHKKSYAVATILTAIAPNPTGYGRIIRSQNQVIKIIEELDADDHTKKIQEINTGTYVFNSKELFRALKKIKINPVKNEYYLTDLIDIFNQRGAKIHSVSCDFEEILNVNKRYELAKANSIMQQRIFRQLMEEGVTILDINSTYIENDVKIGQDTIIYPFSLLYGKTKIGKNCIIGPFAQIRDSIIKNNSQIIQSTITDSIIQNNVSVGPYAHIRNKTILKSDSKIGNFVEATRSEIGSQTKAFHLSYLGDTKTGKNVNFGAGVITANWDGKKKNKTYIGNDAFIGSDTTIIAPAKIKDKSIIKAGSVISNKNSGGKNE